jgi:hypothetical protein
MAIQKKGETPRISTVNYPATYRIRFSGRLDTSWSDLLEGMTVTTTGGKDTPETTALEGQVLDQAALTGIINTLSDLRMPLLSVECLDCSDGAP